MLVGRGQAKYAIVAVDYFTKWAEAQPLSVITEAKITDFVWKNIICCFRIPYSIISDNGKQFDNTKFWVFCNNLGIEYYFFFSLHPKAIG